MADGARQVALDRVEAANTSVHEAKDRAAEKVRKFGGTMRKIGEHLRVEDQHYVAEKAQDLSRRLDDVASYVSSAELATLANDMRLVARRNPTWFYGGAFALGLAAGRFLKGGADGNSRRIRGDVARTQPQTTSIRRAPSETDDASRRDVRIQSTRVISGTSPDARDTDQTSRGGVVR
jgi:hypothetical protein